LQLQLLPGLDKRGENREHQDKEGSGLPLPLFGQPGGRRMHQFLPFSGFSDVSPSARRVDVMRVELIFIFDHDEHLLEMKIAHCAGGMPAMTFDGHTVGSLADDPAVHVDVVRPLLLRLLEEYCEPF
jgi:hypothetical protein